MIFVYHLTMCLYTIIFFQIQNSFFCLLIYLLRNRIDLKYWHKIQNSFSKNFYYFFRMPKIKPRKMATVKICVTIKELCTFTFFFLCHEKVVSLLEQSQCAPFWTIFKHNFGLWWSFVSFNLAKQPNMWSIMMFDFGFSIHL